MTDLMTLVGRADDLRPLSPSTGRLAAVVSAADSSVDDVASAIQYDQALTAAALRLANSAMAASQREITTVREAVIRLGGGRILEHLVAAEVKRQMRQPLGFYGYNEDDLWRHSVAAACAAELLPRFAREPVSGASFTAALLHDIGKLLLVRAAAPDELQQVWDRVGGGEVSCEEAERLVLGYSHAHAGAALCAAWGLPDAIVTAVREHHEPLRVLDPTTDAVCTANAVARAIGEGIGKEGMSFRMSSGLAQRMGLTRENYERLCAETAVRFAGVLSAYGM